MNKCMSSSIENDIIACTSTGLLDDGIILSTTKLFSSVHVSGYINLLRCPQVTFLLSIVSKADTASFYHAKVHP